VCGHLLCFALAERPPLLVLPVAGRRYTMEWVGGEFGEWMGVGGLWIRG
jgi:hypothetical protein